MSDLEKLRRELESANALHKSGNIKDALPIYRGILNQWPQQPDAMHMLGIIAQQMGKSELALQLFEETLKIAPLFGPALVNRATLLRAMGKNEEASASVKKALDVEPNLASAWNLSGILLRDQRDYENAVEHHSRAVSLDGNNANFQHNYANGLLRLGRFLEAYHVAKQALVLDPHQADVITTYADALTACGYPDQAIEFYQKAYAADPRYIDARIHEAEATLLMGCFDRGWKLMESRKLYLHDERILQNMPRWQGEVVEHLLLVAEQGVGDTIQALRFIPQLKNRAHHITLQIPKSLLRLVKDSYPDLIVITPEDPLPRADAFEPLMSLFYHCLLEIEVMPTPLKYLHINESLLLKWRERLKSLSDPRIGFTWAGNPLQINDYNRSMTLTTIKPLMQLSGVHALSLQKSPEKIDLSSLHCFDAAPFLDDFATTAALIEQLDLIITVDTSVAHIAAALGKPAWVLLPFDPGWRYLLGREDSPYYPTMRLFRQDKPRDWSGVIARVSLQLQEYLAGNLSVLTAQAWSGQSPCQNPFALKPQA